MTPASLRQNYINELKFCGDFIFKKNQFWEFIETKGNEQKENVLSKVLGLNIGYIRKHGGAWLIDVRKPSNFFQLKTEEQTNVEKQINLMLSNKYEFINYNGLRENKMKQMEEEGIKYNNGNFFNNKVFFNFEVIKKSS